MLSVPIPNAYYGINDLVTPVIITSSYNAHKHIDGVPHFKHQSPVLDECPTCCLAAKLQKQPASQKDSRRAQHTFQGLSIDFDFIVQASKY
jgi:hypothetical protein